MLPRGFLGPRTENHSFKSFLKAASEKRKKKKVKEKKKHYLPKRRKRHKKLTQETEDKLGLVTILCWTSFDQEVT